MDALFKVWDLGVVVALIFVGAAFAFGAVAWTATSGPSRGRAAPFAGVFLALLALFVCAGVFTRVGRTPEGFVLLEHAGNRRIAAIIASASRGGETCTVRVYRLSDGRYVGGSGFSADCPDRIDGGALALKIRPGLVLAGDLVRVDLWTGRSLGSVVSAAKKELGANDVRVLGVLGDAARVELQDGTERMVPLPAPTTRHATLFASRGEHASFPGLFDARGVGSGCAGRALVTHRSVAFGDGDDLLSAFDEGAEAPAWTIDRGRTVGARVLGAFDHGGDCVVVGGRSGGRLSVARVGPDGVVHASWTN